MYKGEMYIGLKHMYKGDVGLKHSYSTNSLANMVPNEKENICVHTLAHLTISKAYD